MKKVLYILGELADEDLNWLLGAGSADAVGTGSAVINEGETVERLSIVVEGELAISIGGAEITRLGVGEVVGDMSLLSSSPASATVTAATEAVVFSVPHSVMRAKLAADQGFAARFYRALCVFLVNRLTGTSAMVGATKSVPSAGPAPDEGAMNPELLENVSVAGARFDWFLKRLKGGSGS